MKISMEEELTEDFKYAIDRGTEDEVVGSWGIYFNQVRYLDANHKRYDRKLYQNNIKIFHKWKLRLGI